MATPQTKTKRIIVTALHQPDEDFFEKEGRDLHPIATLPLGWGCENCDDTEVEYWSSIATYADIAQKEGSRVFILGYGPRNIPASWIKAAELIIQGSTVEIVLIPLAEKIEPEGTGKILGSVLHVKKNGIYQVEYLGEKMHDSFFRRIISRARRENDR